MLVALIAINILVLHYRLINMSHSTILPEVVFAAVDDAVYMYEV